MDFADSLIVMNEAVPHFKQQTADFAEAAFAARRRARE